MNYAKFTPKMHTFSVFVFPPRYTVFVFPLRYNVFVFPRGSICISIRTHCAQLFSGIMRLLATQSRAWVPASNICKVHQRKNILPSRLHTNTNTKTNICNILCIPKNINPPSSPSPPPSPTPSLSPAPIPPPTLPQSEWVSDWVTECLDSWTTKNINSFVDVPISSSQFLLFRCHPIVKREQSLSWLYDCAKALSFDPKLKAINFICVVSLLPTTFLLNGRLVNCSCDLREA